jgi:hypothetical protein
MATRSLIQLRGFIESLPGGSKNIAPIDISNTTPPEAETQVVLGNGDNTITIPALTRGCVIIFDSTSIVTKTLKGNAADTGVLLRKDSWHVLGFDSPAPASFIITTSGADTAKYTRIIFF